MKKLLLFLAVLVAAFVPFVPKAQAQTGGTIPTIENGPYIWGGINVYTQGNLQLLTRYPPCPTSEYVSGYDETFNPTCSAPAGSAQTAVISQCAAGSDEFATFNNCASLLPNGGTLDARSLGAQTLTVSTPLTLLSSASRPITLLLDPATKFTINTVFTSGSITAGTACAVPVGQGSAIVVTHFNSPIQGNFLAGSSLQTFDVVCNADQSGAQESFVLDGVGVVGNFQATMKGSLIHLKNIFVPTLVANSGTYTPYGNGLTVEGGSDNVFLNDSFSDASTFGPHPSQNYVGNVVTLTGVDNVSFVGGAIQDNGPHNPLLVIQGFSSTFGSAGKNAISVHFNNVDIETAPATVGSFTGAAPDVTPVQETDGTDIVFDHMTVFGDVNPSAGTALIELLSSGPNGQIKGPVEVDNLAVYQVSEWTGRFLIVNSNPGVAPSLASVLPETNGPSLGIGKYRWEGSQVADDSVIDYLDNQIVANEIDVKLNVEPAQFSSLPSCTTSLEGQIASVTDSSTKVWGSTITGGGSNHISAYCNGSAWTVSGASFGASQPVSQAMTICASGCTHTATICTTSALAWANGQCSVGNFTWPILFSDTNYAVTCQAGPTTSGAGAVFAVVDSKATNQITIFLQSATATAATTNEIDCVGIHN
jgi:hypothetical protein